MYNIAFYEEGRFCTNIGGPVNTLPEALEQMKKVATSVKAEELPGCSGYKFDRAGTTCALIITNKWGLPIFNFEED